MANSKYDFHQEEERWTEPKFNRGTYIVVRVDGDKFHRFCSEHKFDKPNDKRALDLMALAAKDVIRTFRGHIPLAYGHSDEFSFLIRSQSSLLSRRVYKITSMIPVVFATSFNSNWDKVFGDRPDYEGPVKRLYDAWFDARPKEYPNYRAVIDYFRWRQVDCHINNLYNTTLHALTGRYVRHELDSSATTASRKTSGDQTKSCVTSDTIGARVRRKPIDSWIEDKEKFFGSVEATAKLSGTVSSEKHDLLFLDYKINYNNELEQFKKGTVVVDTQGQPGRLGEQQQESIVALSVELVKNSHFWDEHRYIFDDHYDSNLISK